MPFVDMDGPRNYIKWTKSDRKKQIYHHSYAKSKNDTNKHIYKTETDSQT